MAATGVEPSAEAVTAYQPSSYDDAVSVRNQVCALLDTEITIAGDQGEDDVYNALRALLKLVGEQHGCELELARVGTPTVGQVERYAPFKKNPSWPRKQVEQLIERAAQMATRHGRVEVQMADIDDDRTGIKVRIAKNETQNTESTLTASLKHVFKVIGNSKGRILLVEVARELEPEEDCQPALNRGRYSNL